MFLNARRVQRQQAAQIEEERERERQRKVGRDHLLALRQRYILMVSAKSPLSLDNAEAAHHCAGTLGQTEWQEVVRLACLCIVQHLRSCLTLYGLLR